jgi:hypothetical protein
VPDSPRWWRWQSWPPAALARRWRWHDDTVPTFASPRSGRRARDGDHDIRRTCERCFTPGRVVSPIRLPAMVKAVEPTTLSANNNLRLPWRGVVAER